MPLEIKKVQAICFDVDGTLSDTDDVMVAQLTKLLHPFEFLFAGKDLSRIARSLVMETAAPANFIFSIPDRIGLDDELYALKDWLVHKSKTRVKPYQLIPGARETLERLKKYYPLAVVSARDTRSTLDFLDQFDLQPFFTCIATDQTCEHTKPFPDPVLWAARQMGVPVEACLMVGDTAVDIRAGKSAGAQTAGVLCGFGEKEELERSGADIIFAITNELVQALGK